MDVRAGGEPADAGPDGEAADADVARDELALLAERRALVVELRGSWRAA